MTISDGTVTATGVGGGAGIGGGHGGSGGVIDISGGIVYAYGSAGGVGDSGWGGAGVGGGSSGDGGTITISDGTVTAIGGNGAMGGAAGIGGGGSFAGFGGSGGDITISGGDVMATGANGGAGVGGGSGGAGGGHIVISGGDLTARGGNYGAGVGGGRGSDGGNIVITGGTVTANSGGFGGAGVGGGSSGNGGTITISSGTITATGVGGGAGVGGGSSGNGGTITISGDPTVTATGNYGGAGVGGGSSGSGGVITIFGGTVTAYSSTINPSLGGGAGIGGGASGGSGNILIYGEGTFVSARGVAGAQDIGTGNAGAVDSVFVILPHGQLTGIGSAIIGNNVLFSADPKSGGVVTVGVPAPFDVTLGVMVGLGSVAEGEAKVFSVITSFTSETIDFVLPGYIRSPSSADIGSKLVTSGAVVEFIKPDDAPPSVEVCDGRILTPDLTGDTVNWVEIARYDGYSLIVRTSYLNVYAGSGHGGDPTWQYVAYGTSNNYIGSRVREGINNWFNNLASGAAVDNLGDTARLRSYTMQNDASNVLGTSSTAQALSDGFSTPTSTQVGTGNDVAFALSYSESAEFLSNVHDVYGMSPEGQLSNALAVENFDKITIPEIYGYGMWLRSAGRFSYTAGALAYNGRAFQFQTDAISTSERGLVYPALWVNSDIFEYDITYVLGDGTNAPDNPRSYKDSDLPLSIADPMSIYEFLGWNVTYNEPYTNGISEDLQKSYTIPEGTYGHVTLTATWSTTLLQYYSVTYDVNGGNSGTGPADVTNLLDGAKVSLSVSGPTHPSVGSVPVVFMGWSLSRVAVLGASDVALVPAFENYVIVNGTSVTVFAVWGFDSDGSGTPDVLEDQYSVIYD
ncbi:MAG: hypothetical protein FWG55_05030, partial [Candidatus Bathyarchaeota archaeon]|nr:hypothetical protein [Candidatus Termiticorpusculum sp.]